MKTNGAAFHSVKCVFKAEFNLVWVNYRINTLIKRLDINTDICDIDIYNFVQTFA